MFAKASGEAAPLLDKGAATQSLGRRLCYVAAVCVGVATAFAIGCYVWRPSSQLSDGMNDLMKDYDLIIVGDSTDRCIGYSACHLLLDKDKRGPVYTSSTVDPSSVEFPNNAFPYLSYDCSDGSIAGDCAKDECRLPEGGTCMDLGTANTGFSCSSSDHQRSFAFLQHYGYEDSYRPEVLANYNCCGLSSKTTDRIEAALKNFGAWQSSRGAPSKPRVLVMQHVYWMMNEIIMSVGGPLNPPNEAATADSMKLLHGFFDDASQREPFLERYRKKLTKTVEKAKKLVDCLVLRTQSSPPDGDAQRYPQNVVDIINEAIIAVGESTGTPVYRWDLSANPIIQGQGGGVAGKFILAEVSHPGLSVITGVADELNAFIHSACPP